MPELKTKVNKASVKKFLSTIKDIEKRKDCFEICAMMEKATKAKPEMWGASIVGFGRRTYTYSNGKTGEWMVIGFAPRKQNISLYGLKVFQMTVNGLKENKKENDFLLKLGKYKEGGGCIYINKLSDINTKELEKIIKLAVNRKKLKDGSRCKVIGGTHTGKSGRVQDINTSKTGAVTITVLQKSGVRFKTLTKNIELL